MDHSVKRISSAVAPVERPGPAAREQVVVVNQQWYPGVHHLDVPHLGHRGETTRHGEDMESDGTMQQHAYCRFLLGG